MRTKLIVAAVAAVLVSGIALAVDGWNYDRYIQMMKGTNRAVKISEGDFNKIQSDREKAADEIEKYLISKFGKADPAIIAAFRSLPRECYTYNYATKVNAPNMAYAFPARPMPIGHGSALSDFLGQAYMTQICQPKSTDVVLEIGTGSGFQISWLSKIVKEAYSIEIIKPVGEGVKEIFAPLGINNVHTRVGDGFFGWPEVKDGFDIIIVTCAAQYVPPALIAQLKKGGRMICPVGQPFKKGQFFYIYTRDAEGRIHSRKDVGCYFVPMTGSIQANAAKK